MEEKVGINAIRVCYQDEDKGDPREYKVIHEPSPEDLKPTPREKRVMQGLLDWQKASAQVYWEIGKPVGEFVY